MTQDISLFIQSLNKAGFAVEIIATPLNNQIVTCAYRNNPDGSMRWVWPASTKHPDFLKFYHASGFRPKFFSLMATVLAAFGLLKKLSHGHFSFYTNIETFNLISNKWNKRWAWFSGTVGPNRKCIVWHRVKNGASDIFIKIPLSQKATDNLLNEGKQLRHFRVKNFRHIVLPTPENMANGCLRLSDIGRHAKRTNQLKKLPFNAVQEWLLTGFATICFATSGFCIYLKNKIQLLQQLQDERLPKGMIGKLTQLANIAPKFEMQQMACAHGDFTPWNVMVRNKMLHCIDWELSRNEMPVMFDLFQFVYQSNILIGNKGYKAIRQELDFFFALPEWRDFIKKHKIHTTDAEKLYLLYTMAYYLETYQQQPVWHVQINWLLKTWNEALNWHLYKRLHVPARQMLLKDLQLLLKTKQYAILKWMYQGIETLPEASDLDICIIQKDAAVLISELQKNVLIAGINLNTRSFMVQVEIILKDGSSLYLDLINTFKRKSIVFLNAANLLANAAENEYGFKVPAPKDDFAYVWLFYWLNHSDVPERYQLFFQTYNKEVECRFNQLLQEEYNLPIIDFREVFNQNKVLNKRMGQMMMARKENKGIRLFYHQFQYYMDLIRNLFSKKGFIITFSGVDGAGKSTVIENVRQLVDKQLRKKVVVIRHRPSLLPILSAWKHGKQQAEKNAAQTLPRQGRNKSKWSSMFRFGYYYFDYLIGQWYVQLRYVMFGYVVLYDRYYFDFIVDAKRSNINISSYFIAWCYRFLLKPRLNFFLYADEALILKRKQELDAPTIRVLTKKYLALFKVFKKRAKRASYIPVENKELAQTLHFIFNHIKSVSHDTVL